LLLVPERHDRIDARGANGGYQAGGSCHDCDEHRPRCAVTLIDVTYAPSGSFVRTKCFDPFARSAAIGVIGATSYVVDFMAAAVGVKRLGASRRAMTGAALGTFAGLVFGLPGIVIGPFVGALVGELTVHRDWKRAGRAGVAAWIGFAIGTAVKAALAFVMVGIFTAALVL
jgi:uncharacterized protein YqgC (DUF456 family)